MNQVTEILQLPAAERQAEAIERLQSLFEMMKTHLGFVDAELLVDVDHPELLLVLHTWEDISDWQDFRASDDKISFMATRPEDLYSFVSCGTNWLLESTAGEATETRYLRREVLRGPYVAPLLHAPSQTFRYQDYEPAFQGATLRLSRLDAPSDAAPTPALGIEVIADAVYETVTGTITRDAVAGVVLEQPGLATGTVRLDN